MEALIVLIRSLWRAHGLALALVLALLPAAVADAAPDPEDGIALNVQNLVRSDGHFSDAEVVNALRVMASDGLRGGRVEARWSEIEPAAPGPAAEHTYDWSGPDQTAAWLAAFGIRWQPILYAAPMWASVDPSSKFAAPGPGHVGDYAAFAAAFVRRYGPGGAFWAAHPELPALPVRTLEVWNEENTTEHWGAAPDAAAYGALYAAAREAVKAVAPAVAVEIGGVVWNDDANYLRGALAAIGPEAVDAVALHPYAPTAFALVPNVQRMRKVLDDAGRSDVPLVLNELGWPAAYDRAPAKHGADGPVDDRSRAGTLALLVEALAPSTCNISGLDIFDGIETEENPALVESFMGIYRHDTSATASSRALWDAVARYRASAAAGLPPVPVCGARGATRTRVLPLQLTAEPTPDGCHHVTVTYRGLPLEEAQVHVLAPYRGVVATDAGGEGLVCPWTPGGNVRLHLVADVPGLAASNHVICDLPGSRCRALGAAAACALSAARVATAGPLKPSQSVALRIRSAGCTPEQGGPVTLSAAAVLPQRTARRLGVAGARRDVPLLGGQAVLSDPGGTVTFPVRLTKRGRRALAQGRRIAVQLTLTASEADTQDAERLRVVLQATPRSDGGCRAAPRRRTRGERVLCRGAHQVR